VLTFGRWIDFVADRSDIDLLKEQSLTHKVRRANRFRRVILTASEGRKSVGSF
jgi:hypothetical protein